jgi:putative effector of murein hydrolase LrgA (UPF0299 family)
MIFKGVAVGNALPAFRILTPYPRGHLAPFLNLRRRSKGGKNAFSFSAKSSPAGNPAEKVLDLLKTGAGVSAIFALERSISYAGIVAGARVPSAPVGMVCVFSALLILNLISKRATRSVQQFFSPALAFYGLWVPLFFSPPLVQLPLALRGISGDTLLRLGAILSVGTVLSLASTAAIVQWLRTRWTLGLAATQTAPASPAVPSTTTLTAGTPFAAGASLAAPAGYPLRPNSYQAGDVLGLRRGGAAAAGGEPRRRWRGRGGRVRLTAG